MPNKILDRTSPKKSAPTSPTNSSESQMYQAACLTPDVARPWMDGSCGGGARRTAVEVGHHRSTVCQGTRMWASSGPPAGRQARPTQPNPTQQWLSRQLRHHHSLQRAPHAAAPSTTSTSTTAAPARWQGPTGSGSGSGSSSSSESLKSSRLTWAGRHRVTLADPDA